MEISFRIDKYHVDKSGLCPVFVDCNYNGLRLKFSIGLKSSEKDWDSTKMKFRRSYFDYLSGNLVLENIESRLRVAYRESLANGVIPTTQTLRETIRPKKELVRKSFIESYKSFLNGRKSGVSPATHKSYYTIVSRLNKFESVSGRLWVESYNQSVHDSFRDFQIDVLNLHPNSVAKSDSYLRTFFISMGIGKQIIWKCGEIEPETIFLTRQELEAIRVVELSATLAKVRDSFVFSCFTGLRYGDLRKLTSSEIKSRSGYFYIELIPNKSRSKMKQVKKIEVPIPSQAMEIINRYSGSYTSLPVLSNQKMNEYLKDIARIAEINQMSRFVAYELGNPVIKYYPKYQLVTVHVARHTYATLSLIYGVSIEIIQNVLGHSDIKTTRRYAKIVDEYKNAVILDAWK